MAKETRVEEGKKENREREREKERRKTGRRRMKKKNGERREKKWGKNIEKMITTQRNLRRDQARGKFRCESNRGANGTTFRDERGTRMTRVFLPSKAAPSFRNSGYSCYRVLFAPGPLDA